MKSSQETRSLSLIISVAIGWAFYWPAIREAIEQFRERWNWIRLSRYVLDSGLVLRKMGRYELALAEGEKGVKLSGGSPLMNAGAAQNSCHGGKREKAIQILDELTELAKQKYVASYFFAGIHVGLGEEGSCNGIPGEILRRALPLAACICTWIRAWTAWSSNLRFQDLLGRVGLPCAPQFQPERQAKVASCGE